MYILLASAILPVVGLGKYIYKKDVNHEPSGLLTKIFIYGFLSSIPILIIELILANYFPTEGITNFITMFINIFVGVALVEEGFKWIVTKKFGYDNKEFDEIYDVIVYSVFASLGFACIENILYVLSNGLVNALFRALLSLPGHTCFGVMMGYFFAQAKIGHINGNDRLYKNNLLYSIVVPCLFHTFYDAFLFYYQAVDNLLFILLFFIFDIVMVVICFKTVNKISQVQQTLNTNIKEGVITSTSLGQIEYHGAEKVINFCPVCGNSVRGCNFCSSCGFKVSS